VENLGCRLAVAKAIGWFFAMEEEGIILEDDVLPLPYFFPYCEALLERYRFEPRVAMIGGANLVSNLVRPSESYLFSRYTHIWGWASWSRAWKNYDVGMEAWPAWRDQGGINEFFKGDILGKAYWKEIFQRTYENDINTWDYQWLFTLWRTRSLCIIPALCQVTNLGFGSDGTHTCQEAPNYIRDSPAQSLSFPLVHPAKVEPYASLDQVIGRVVFQINPVTLVKQWIRQARLARWVTRFWRKT
jgi:hypothetical protein